MGTQKKGGAFSLLGCLLCRHQAGTVALVAAARLPVDALSLPLLHRVAGRVAAALRRCRGGARGAVSGQHGACHVAVPCLPADGPSHCLERGEGEAGAGAAGGDVGPDASQLHSIVPRESFPRLAAHIPRACCHTGALQQRLPCCLAATAARTNQTAGQIFSALVFCKRSAVTTAPVLMCWQVVADLSSCFGLAALIAGAIEKEKAEVRACTVHCFPRQAMDRQQWIRAYH